MWIKKPSKLSENLFYIGNYYRNSFVWKGKDAVYLIEGALLCDYFSFYKNAKNFGIDIDSVDYIVLLHSHFDHVSMTPIIKEKNPRVKVIASLEASKAFEDRDYLGEIEKLNSIYCKRLKIDLSVDFSLLKVDLSLKGSRFGDELSFIEAKGHTDCSMFLYIEDEKALFTSDSGGIPLEDGSIVHFGTTDLRAYVKSLESVLSLEVDKVCMGHGGIFVGEDAKEFLSRSYGEALRLYDKILSYKEKGYSPKEIVDILLPFYIKPPISKIGRIVVKDSLFRMAKSIFQ